MAKKHRSGAVAVARVESSRAVIHDDAIRVSADGSVLIDFSRLRPPQNLYDADYAWAARRLGAVSLFFAKGYPGRGKDKLRTRVELRYPFEPFVRHFWENSRPFHERLRDYLSKHPLESEAVDLGPVIGMDAEKDHSEWVNFDYLAHTGSQAALDFFHVPPSGVARFAQGQGSSGLVLTPVLRVHTTACNLSRLLDSCESLVNEIAPHLSGGDPS